MVGPPSIFGVRTQDGKKDTPLGRRQPDFCLQKCCIVPANSLRNVAPMTCPARGDLPGHAGGVPLGGSPSAYRACTHRAPWRAVCRTRHRVLSAEASPSPGQNRSRDLRRPPPWRALSSLHHRFPTDTWVASLHMLRWKASSTRAVRGSMVHGHVHHSCRGE